MSVDSTGAACDMLVAIEGIDGAGKGTQTRLLAGRASVEGLSVATVSFPRYGKTNSSRLIADYLNGRMGTLQKVSPHLVGTLFALDRLESQRHLQTLLKEHTLVLADRYVGSNLAYQGARIPESGRDEYIQWLSSLEFKTYGMPRPDLTIYFNIIPQLSAGLVSKKQKRSYTEATHDLHEENTVFQAEVHATYGLLLNDGLLGVSIEINCQNEDGTLRSVEHIGDEAWMALKAQL